ncbi:MAG TPA: hypothetical protein VK524_07210 [Polyangiaceae bacterium]|nr:hypothetical protein [Polyangiaceae bacterium]
MVAFWALSSDAVNVAVARGSEVRDPQIRARLRAKFARHKQRAHQELRARLPKPHLPEAERSAWIARWNRMRACAAAHGFEGVSVVEPTYGNGKTPMPNVDMDRPNAAAALAACPFETTAGR